VPVCCRATDSHSKVIADGQSTKLDEIEITRGLHVG